MKKTVKKLTAVALTLTSVMSLAACGSSAKNDKPTQSNVTKPDKFSVMVDNTVVKDVNAAQDFYDYLKSVDGGVEIEWIRPDHASYYDTVSTTFNDEQGRPDVVLLSQDYYNLYAFNGFLWNMQDAWNNSETKNSGRLVKVADETIKQLTVYGDDGTKGLYGFAPFRGNGCVTLVREEWAKAAGYSKADIENKTLTFDQYYAMCKKMTQVKGVPAISCSGFIGNEAPYTNFLPEFYQQAQFTFYKNSSGQYVDGFTEKAMKDALTRIATGIKDGVIDKESVNLSTQNVRDKYYADKCGVFTYWAGVWVETVRQNLASHNLDDSMIELKPIKELGSYIERIAPAWCITSKANNPEGIFKYFLDKILDGGDCQTAWTYGAKGTHWDNKAETVTVLNQTTPGTTYKEGEFHMLPSTETPTVLMQKNFLDPTLSLATFKDNKDPGAASVADLIKTSAKFFNDNSQVVQVLPMTQAEADNISVINKERKNVISKVVTGAMTVDEGMAEYNSTVGKMAQEVVDSLNKLK